MKTIVVYPDASLSLQMHHHRAEHWIVVQGTDVVEKDGTEELGGREDRALGESDIVRLENRYGRTD